MKTKCSGTWWRFVRKLPDLTPEQYETLVKDAPKHEELMGETGSGHEHNGQHD